MKCPYCRHPESCVKDSRPLDDGRVKRRRQCLSCGRRWSTFEQMEHAAVKKAAIKILERADQLMKER
jgi:transcriptional repressor NrdR